MIVLWIGYMHEMSSNFTLGCITFPPKSHTQKTVSKHNICNTKTQVLTENENGCVPDTELAISSPCRIYPLFPPTRARQPTYFILLDPRSGP